MLSQWVEGMEQGFPMSASQIITLANDDVVHCNVSVPLGAPAAFEMFRHDIFRWWPRELTFSGEALEDLFLEGRRGGMLWERGPDGFRVDWARILRWLPPNKMVLRWHVGPNRQPQPNPAFASLVEIRFVPDARNTTRVELDHRDILRHGRGAAEYRAHITSDGGWPYILNAYARHCVAHSSANECFEARTVSVG
jgi:hypothetical protein